MTDLLVYAIGPILAISAFAAVFGLFMASLIDKQRSKESEKATKPNHTMAE